MNTLEILPINKTCVFHSPLEGNNCLVRTGTIDNMILSFFNSVLISCSKNFKRLEKENRNKLIFKVRDVIFTKLNKKMWRVNGLQTFKQILNETLVDFYKYINTTENIHNPIIKKIVKKLVTNKKEFSLYEIITEILPYTIIIDAEEPQDNLIESYIKMMKNNVKTHLQTVDIFDTLSEDNIDYIIKNISNFLSVLTEEVEYLSFKNYKYETDEVNEMIVDITAEYFSSNIYFIDSKTRLPFVKNNIETFDNMNSIIVLSLDSTHYEAVGLLLHRNEINYEFLCDDMMVIKMNKLINIKYNERKRREIDRVAEPEVDTKTDNVEPKVEPEVDTKMDDVEPKVEPEVDTKTDNIEPKVEPEVDTKTDDVETKVEPEVDTKTDDVEPEIKEKIVDNTPSQQTDA